VRRLPGVRSLLLLIDGLGLLGVVVFSVLSALEPDQDAYTVAQIISAALVLGTVLLLRQINRRPQP
jgi:hypothetical protein